LSFQIFQKEEAIDFVAHAILGINNRLQSNDELKTLKLNERCVKFQLKLSEWVQQEGDKVLESAVFKSVEKILLNDAPVKQPGIMSASEFFVGKLMNNGVKKCPDLAKAWSCFGNWCYRWGKKMVESKTDSEGLRPIDFQSIKQLLPEAGDEEAGKIVNILNQQHITAEDEDIGPNEVSSTELIENQLKAMGLPFEIEPKKMQEIVVLWKEAHRNVYKYYELSADAYFKYLQLSCSETAENKDSSVVTATLRLLRLIVKHALGLQEVLEEGLAKSPSEPWKVIIPQLFSRLSHHEPYVR
jgi:PI-3-kinase-related kinase SMG-1